MWSRQAEWPAGTCILLPAMCNAGILQNPDQSNSSFLLSSSVVFISGKLAFSFHMTICRILIPVENEVTFFVASFFSQCTHMGCSGTFWLFAVTRRTGSMPHHFTMNWLPKRDRTESSIKVIMFCLQITTVHSELTTQERQNKKQY